MRTFISLLLFVVVLTTACGPSTPTSIPSTNTPPFVTPTPATARPLLNNIVRNFTGLTYASPYCTAASGGQSPLCEVPQGTSINVIARLFTGDDIFGLGEGSTRNVTIITEVKDCGESAPFWNQYVSPLYGCAAVETKREFYIYDPPDTANFQFVFPDLEGDVPQEGQTITFNAVAVAFVWDDIPENFTALARGYSPSDVGSETNAQVLTDVGQGNTIDWYHTFQFRFYVDGQDAQGNGYYMPGRIFDGRAWAAQTGNSSYRVDPGQWPEFTDAITIDAGGAVLTDMEVGIEMFCAPVALCSVYWQTLNPTVR